jgi:hypothetical protein
MPEKDLAESLDTEDVHNAFGQCEQLLDRLHLLHLIKQVRVHHMATTRHPNAPLESGIWLSSPTVAGITLVVSDVTPATALL